MSKYKLKSTHNYNFKKNVCRTPATLGLSKKTYISKTSTIVICECFCHLRGFREVFWVCFPAFEYNY